MLLTINPSDFEISDTLQIKVKLEPILNKAEYTEDIPFNHAPLSIDTVIRTGTTNYILVDNEGKCALHSYLRDEKLIHRGYDLLMYVASQHIKKVFFYDGGLDSLMYGHSAFYPIGFYNSSESLPTIYSYVVLDDNEIEVFESHLRPEYRFIPIEDLEDNKFNHPLYSFISLWR